MSREGGGRSLRPTSLGRVLTAFLAAYFPTYVDPGFTSGMEEQLDDVAGESALVFVRIVTEHVMGHAAEGAKQQNVLGRRSWTA